MNTFFSQLKKEAQKIQLSPQERKRMLSVLERTMHSRHSAKSPIRMAPSSFVFFVPRFVSSLAFVLILAVIGGSTAYAAEGALPGDLLYPVKIGFNEPITAALAVSSEAKAAVHARFAERRMQEVETLTARGGMTAETKTAIEEHFNEHARMVDNAVAVVEENDPVAAAAISTRFESAVAAHGAVIERLSGEGESEVNRRESREFARSLKEHGRRVALAQRSVSLSAEGRGSKAEVHTLAQADIAISISVPAFDNAAMLAARLTDNASTTLEEADIRLDALRGKLSATTTARVKRQIDKTREFIKNLRDGDKEQVGKALKDAETLKVFIEAQEKFREHLLLPAPDDGENGEDDLSGVDEEQEKENEDRDDGPLSVPPGPSL